MVRGLPGGDRSKFVRDAGVSVIEKMYQWAKGKTQEHQDSLGSGLGGGASAKGLVGNALTAMGIFRRMFPNMTIGGWRAHGSVPGSDHPHGKALDLMTGSGSVAQKIISTFMGQAGKKYWIWNRQIATSSGGFMPRPYHGPSPHTDHVHLSYYKRGGITGYANGTGAGGLPEDIMGIGPSGRRYKLHRGEEVTPKGEGGRGGTVIHIGQLVVQASTPAEGRRAGRAFMSVVESHQITRDARTS
jgi:hypothetical protein